MAGNQAEPTAVIEVVERPTPRKRRRFGWLIAVIAILAVLVLAFFAADVLARQYAADYVRDRVVQVLALDPATQIDVDLGPGSILLQAARGSVDEVTVTAPELTFGEITGSVQLTATAVPLSGEEPVETLAIAVRVDEQNVRKLASFISGSQLGSIELSDGVIRVTAELDALFFVVPVALDIAPTATAAGIGFEPVAIKLGERSISVPELRADPVFGGLAGQLLASREFCVASYLPAALTVAEVEVAGNELVVVIDGDGVALGAQELSTPGSCP